MKKIIAFFAICLSASIAKAQLFHTADLYPTTTSIKSRSFNGTGKGFWSFKLLDTLGRVMDEKIYRKKELVVNYLYTYNDKNDITTTIAISEKNPYRKRDTTTYIYTYLENHISQEQCIYHNNRGDQYNLISHQDSVFTYHYISYSDWARQQDIPATAETHILTYRQGLLVKKESIRPNGDKTTTWFEYDTHQQLIRRKIERDPILREKTVYTGGPGSDDQYYSYIYDKKGRIKRLYTTVEDKTYQLATYQYKDR
ncbi:hypothetical protein [Chitinophaga nivalis]|uniref:YD repeat-containing protein n=1 Tax=Chitinophaga nivalis TaxID=2991709 RepID=A0ABT3IH50_9BACT|nr:hypothetical protein [Chitinophaga nivalis]MCW3467038.1 hypothetical protein [Chitinophaga nivalis]MCW3483271.1 hypothetical protein [Chitinophaga nivalis]